MTVNNRKLKGISLQFRNIASRALQSNNEDARVNIRRLLKFVSETPLLRQEIDKAPAPSNLDEIWGEEAQRDRITYPDEPDEELGLLHAILIQLSKPDTREFWAICYGYGGVRHMHDCIPIVLEDTVGKYSDHLRQVIEMALLHSEDPAYDHRDVSVTITGGTNQVNLSQDNSSMNAQQSLSSGAPEILKAVQEITSSMMNIEVSGIKNETLEELRKTLDTIEEEVRRVQPRSSVIRSAKEKLELLTASVSAVKSMAPLLQGLIAHMGGYLPLST